MADFESTSIEKMFTDARERLNTERESMINQVRGDLQAQKASALAKLSKTS